MKHRAATAVLVLAALVSLPASAIAPGDPVRGEAIYARCQACHALGYDRTGPKHCGLFGRRAGGVPGFRYSPAMAQADVVWDANTLDRFLANPTGMMPGTAMGYAGIADRQERADLIAWLRQASASPIECPP
ncbi:cytochrome c family protein [Aromatoleum evansii]|uniref:Cytochrome c family protein n=1 Tax=Aromatoleum evansii TaxID=59406 RepID=A0ABZ1AVG0_AROEV|nr:Cytochrome c2 precursor [Azoarcus sp. Aa7]WRL48814.1 cytochrome c family protein [Aromatoleum evansii]